MALTLHGFYKAAMLLSMALLFLQTSSLAVGFNGKTCYSRQHRDAIVNVRVAVERNGAVTNSVAKQAEKDCILACCSEEVEPGIRCNMVVYKPSSKPGNDNCYLFHCKTEQDCPLMPAKPGVNTYDISKDVIHPTAKGNGQTTVMPFIRATPAKQLTTTQSTSMTMKPTTTTPKVTLPPMTTTTTQSTTTTSTTQPTTTTTFTTLPTTTVTQVKSTTTTEPPSESAFILVTMPDITMPSTRATTTTPASTTTTTTTTTTKELASTTTKVPSITSPTTTTTATTTTTQPPQPRQPPAKPNKPSKKPFKPPKRLEPQAGKSSAKVPTTKPTTTPTTTTTHKPTTTPTTTPPTTTTTTTTTSTTTTTTTTTTSIATTERTTTVVVMEMENDLKDVASGPDNLIRPAVGSATGEAKRSQIAWKNSLVAVVVVMLICITLILAIIFRKAMESFDRRHYTRLELNDLHYEI